MKTSLLLLGLSLVAIMDFSCGLPPKKPKGKNIQIRIELDSSINDCEQKVYLHRYNDNDRIIDDSATIKKGQKEIYLYANGEYERGYRILFSQKGPIDWFLIDTQQLCGGIHFRKRRNLTFQASKRLLCHKRVCAVRTYLQQPQPGKSGISMPN